MASVGCGPYLIWGHLGAHICKLLCAEGLGFFALCILQQIPRISELECTGKWQEIVTEHGRMAVGLAWRTWDTLLNGRGHIWSLGPGDLSLDSLQALRISSTREDYYTVLQFGFTFKVGTNSFGFCGRGGFLSENYCVTMQMGGAVNLHADTEKHQGLPGSVSDL